MGSKRDDSPTPPSQEVDAARDTANKPTVPILAVITNTITNTDTAAQSPQHEQQKPKTTTTTNPLLLRWMQENSLNLQAWSREEEDENGSFHMVPATKAVVAVSTE